MFEKEDKIVKFGLIVVGIFVGVFIIWMGLAPLDSAAVAPGQVVVANNKKQIQHLEGGVVNKIYVKDGSQVKAGDVLVEIKNAQVDSSIDILKKEFLQASVLVSRLEAQRDNKNEIIWDEAVVNEPDFKAAAAGQQSIFDEQNKLLKDEIFILNQRIDQLKKQITGTQAIVSSRQKRVGSLNEETREWQRLYKEQLTDKIRLRDIERERVDATGQIASGNADIARLEVQITETKQQILLRERTFKEDVLKQYEDAKLKLNDASARLRAYYDQQNRAAIKSPVDGTVVELITHTIGGVVKPGETIMSIVPSNAEYIVEAQLPTIHIDKVFVGLPADVRFSAFNTQTAEVIEGKVSYVSADSLTDQHGNPFYQIKAELTEEGVKAVEKNGFFLQPGMPAEVIVKTGRRTLLSYFLKPFDNMLKKAFNED